MNPEWEKALRSLASAKALLSHDDPDSTISRAYFAMFQAARAVLRAADPQPTPKKHSQVIRRVSLLIVQARRMDPSLGRAFKSAFQFRQKADYSSEMQLPQRAQRCVAAAEAFVAAMAKIERSITP